jgi:hypothetical protein
VINVVVRLTVVAWLALEAGPLIRDRVRGTGSTARGRGTLWMDIITTAPVVAAGMLAGVLKNADGRRFRPTGPSMAGIR